ncbi:MAG: beta-hydroxyacyl-ACP dehydratase [Phycisphaerales bacterium]|nr:MAG: beta-hydroxyacyl-ACP dehydratase [Phycisphaerales bacterium]
MWIDKFVEFKSGSSAVAVKNVTLAEEHLHDHFPGFPVMPESLMIEAMAQTAGILVGQVRNFEEKVILAKIKKAEFFDYVKPGDTLRLEAEIGSVAREAASTSGRITLIRHESPEQASREDLTKDTTPGPAESQKLIAEIDLMFSHIDQNLAGKKFPEENFVFSGSTFESLLRYLPSDSAGSSEHRSEQQ